MGARVQDDAVRRGGGVLGEREHLRRRGHAVNGGRRAGSATTPRSPLARPDSIGELYAEFALRMVDARR